MDHRQFRVGDFEHVAVGQDLIGRPIWMHLVPEHAVVRVQVDGSIDRSASSTAALMWSLCPGAHDRGHVPPSDPSDDRIGIVRGIHDEDLIVVSDEPDVVLDLEVLAVEREYAVVRTMSTRGIEYHHRSQDLAEFHLVERILYLIDRDGFGDVPVEVQTAGQIEVDQHGEVPRGQAVAVPGGLESASSAEELHIGSSTVIVGSGTPT